jgi:hypothetical protein
VVDVDSPLFPARIESNRGRAATRFRAGLGVLAGLLILAGSSWLVGCVSTVTPPRKPSDPITVYLVADAYHAGVVLPDPAGGMVEYTYGDWDWYALGHDRWYHVFETLFWPTQGALGRRRFQAQDPDQVGRHFQEGSLHPFQAARPRIEALRARLEACYRQGTAREVFNASHQLTFVPDDRDYSLFQNCNDATADWVRELGCTVSWRFFRTGLELRKS